MSSRSHHCQHLELAIRVWWASQVVLVVKNPPADAGDIRDTGLIPESGRSPGGGHSNPLQYSCLENPIYSGAWRTTVGRITESRIWLKRLSTNAQLYGLGPCLWLHLGQIVPAEKAEAGRERRPKLCGAPGLLPSKSSGRPRTGGMSKSSLRGAEMVTQPPVTIPGSWAG